MAGRCGAGANQIFCCYAGATGAVPDAVEQRRHYLHQDYANEKREAWEHLGEQIDTLLNNAYLIPFTTREA